MIYSENIRTKTIIGNIYQKKISTGAKKFVTRLWFPTKFPEEKTDGRPGA